MMDPENIHDKIKFSHHARSRQEQRNITDEAVSSVMQRGEKIDGKNTTTFVDEKFKIVKSNDTGTVITVNKNTRNTRFLLSDRTKERKEKLLFEANVKNNNHAMCELADLYLSGELGEKDVKKAYDLFERAANMGNSHAMCKIAIMYQDGTLGEPNTEFSDRWMKRSADRNNVFALGVTGQKLLAKYLEKYPPDSNLFRPSAPKKEILHYLTKAADKSSTRAMWQIGNIYERGLLGEKDLSKAIELYVKAGKTGSPASLDSLHQLTLNCKFSCSELEEILDHLSTFLPSTSLGMAFQLGEEQLNGSLGYNPVRGLNMIEQTAFKQNVEAMNRLAKCYRDGTECDENLKLSQYWFQKKRDAYEVSAKAGNFQSLWNLGTMYFNGYGCDIDLEKAESCFKEFTEKYSDPNDIYELGKLYLQGKLGNKPIDTGIKLIAQAIKLWQLQAESGDMKFISQLGKAYLFIKNTKKALHWLLKAPTDNDQAQLTLAEIYLKNVYCEKNVSLGLKILENLILEQNISPSSCLNALSIPINDEILPWLSDIAAKQLSDKGSNLYGFQEFAVSSLAKIYEIGKFNDINYDLASHYYHQLFVDFENIEAIKKLTWFHIDQNLPSKYHDAVKDWVLQIPSLIDSSNELSLVHFKDYVLLLGKLYKLGDMLPLDIQESAKWLYLASYLRLNQNENDRIKRDLESLTSLNDDDRHKIVLELTKMSKNFKITSLKIYKVMSRILGDIFYDNRIIEKNIDESVYWYLESSNLNNSSASFSLAKIYHQENQDINLSIKWYMLSVRQGSKKALKVLLEIPYKEECLQIFLNGYKHQSLVEESELTNVNPLKNLETFPTTAEEMFDLGKTCLNLGDAQNILTAAFWFKQAMNNHHINATIKLYNMYKSGALGDNLVSCSEDLYRILLIMCYNHFNKLVVLRDLNIDKTLSLLKNISLVLKLSNICAASTLNEKIAQLVSCTNNVNKENLKNILTDLEKIYLQYYNSQSAVWQAVEVCLLAEDLADGIKI